MLCMGNNNITVEGAADPDLLAPDLAGPFGFPAAGSTGFPAGGLVDDGQVIN